MGGHDAITGHAHLAKLVPRTSSSSPAKLTLGAEGRSPEVGGSGASQSWARRSSADGRSAGSTEGGAGGTEDFPEREVSNKIARKKYCVKKGSFRRALRSVHLGGREVSRKEPRKIESQKK